VILPREISIYGAFYLGNVGKICEKRGKKFEQIQNSFIQLKKLDLGTGVKLKIVRDPEQILNKNYSFL
jgi:hypothetical protein